MLASRLFFPTLREVPAEAEFVSHKLLLRGAFIRRLAAGVYTLLPLGCKVIKKIEQIIRDEMDSQGAQELLMPALQPEELWRETGRWDLDVLLKLKDSEGRSYTLGITHEEVITDLVRRDVRSYRDLPLNLYQIQTKFRDEPRPRGGLIRGREFIMLDAYSFDKNETDLDRVYEKMFTAFSRIFARCGLETRAVEAESGAIGGSVSHEFMVLTPCGEDTVFFCDSCDYAANAERCEIGEPEQTSTNMESLPIQLVETPGAKTVEQVTAFLDVKAQNLVKTLLYTADGRPVAALVRGDRELNEAKLRRALQADHIEMAGPELVRELTGAEVGFAGPVGLQNVLMTADREVSQMSNFVTGANRTDAHYINVNLDRDFRVADFADLRMASDDDPCPRCKGKLVSARAIEVAHIFKLGTKYSETMNADFKDEEGNERPVVMGCYGLGVSRLPAAVVETHNDQNGIIWPVTIAPFEAVIILVNPQDENQAGAALSVYEELQEMGVDVLLDERDERSGVKFKDADLLGIPVQMVAGRSVAEGRVEVRLRGSGEDRKLVPLDQAAEIITSMIKSGKSRLEEEADRIAPRGE